MAFYSGSPEEMASSQSAHFFTFSPFTDHQDIQCFTICYLYSINSATPQKALWGGKI